MSQGLGLLDVIVNPFIASEAKCCCYHVWEEARELACLPQLLVLLKSQCEDSRVLRWSTVAVALHVAPEVLAEVLLVWVGNVLQDSAAIWD